MAKTRRTKSDEPLKVRFVLNGKDWDEYSKEEQERYRVWVTDRTLEISFRPLEERYGAARFGAVLKAFLHLWREEQAGQGPKVLEERLMNSEAPWPFVLGRMIEMVLAESEGKHHEPPPEPQRYVICFRAAFSLVLAAAMGLFTRLRR